MVGGGWWRVGDAELDPEQTTRADLTKTRAEENGGEPKAENKAVCESAKRSALWL
eukprot:COSAG05_NODE_21962_length_268_cov_0.609467_1_plen_54_part_01